MHIIGINKFDETLMTDLRKIFYLFIVSRLLFFLSLFFSIFVAHVHYDFGSVYLTHDGIHYYDIALKGYTKEYQYAFFPLFPLIIRIFSYMHIAIPGTLFLNHILTLTIAYLLYFTGRNIMQKSNVICYIMAKLWLFSPITITTCILYTEPLFVFLTLSAYYLYKTKRYFMSGIVLGCSILTRSTGSMLYFAFFVVMVLDFLSLKGETTINNIFMMYIPATILSCLYPVYLFSKLGNWHYFLDVQFEYWSRVNSNITSVIYYDLMLITSDPITFTFTYISFLISIYLIYKSIRETKQYELILYMVFSIIAIFSTRRIPAMDFPSASYYRYFYGIISMYLLINETMMTTRIHLINFAMCIFTMMVYCMGGFLI